jgi:hypothetical protein
MREFVASPSRRRRGRKPDSPKEKAMRWVYLVVIVLFALVTGKVRVEEATSWGSLSYICRPAQRRPFVK